MSTRSQDRPPRGQEPDARKTTQQSMIAAIGASGAVIAGGITSFVLLVGVVSFDVWPMSDQAGPGSGTALRVAELAPEPAPAADAPAAVVPFGSGLLVTVPAVAALVPEPSGNAKRPKLAGGRDIAGGAPSTPVAQAPEPAGGSDTPGSGGGSVAADAEEPIPQEPDEEEADQDDSNGRPQRPSRPVRPTPPAPTPAPAPVTSGATTPSSDSGSSSGGGPGGSGSGGNGNHGGRG